MIAKRICLDTLCSVLHPKLEKCLGFYRKSIRGHEFDNQHIKKELGDCLWMIAEACTALGFEMDDVAQTNIDKLKARFPDGFNVDKDLHRKAGDV